MEEEKTVTLRPVLALHGYAVDFSQKPGKMTYRFCVKSGEVEIHHHSYDGAAGFWCLLAGGLCYTLGAILYGMGKKIPYIHSVFHLFVLAGSVLHTITVYQVVK